MTSASTLPTGATAQASSDGANWTCPFCSLLCDRFSVTRGTSLALTGSDCPRAVRALATFEPNGKPALASINGKPADPGSALDAAAALLHGSRQPLFGGLATDVAGARALYTLANRCNAILDHAHGADMLHGMRSLQDRGGFTTSLAEIRNRADLIVCIGTQPATKHPEFFRRCGLTGDTQDGEQTLARNVVFLGTPVDPAATDLPGITASEVPLQEDLYQTLAVLNALCRRQPLADDAFASAGLRALAGKLREASYVAVVYTPSTLAATTGGTHAALLLESIGNLVKVLNRTTRAGALSLGGDDGGNTVNYAVTWLSGLPLRTGVLADGLEHDPHRYDSARLLRDKAVDALLWVASFTPDLPPPETDLPTITLGHPALAESMRDRRGVFIPVSTPGIGSAGHLFRTDGGIVLPLTPVYDDGLPTAGAIAAQLLARMPQREEAAR